MLANISLFTPAAGSFPGSAIGATPAARPASSGASPAAPGFAQWLRQASRDAMAPREETVASSADTTPDRECEAQPARPVDEQAGRPERDRDAEATEPAREPHDIVSELLGAWWQDAAEPLAPVAIAGDAKLSLDVPGDEARELHEASGLELKPSAEAESLQLGAEAPLQQAEASQLLIEGRAGASPTGFALELRELSAVKTSDALHLPAPGVIPATASGPASTAAPVAGHASPAPNFTLPTPVESAEFPQAVAHQVSYWVREGVQQAQLHLNPAEMGPVSVQIALNGQQAQVDFAAASAATRAALEAGMAHLAAALQSAGLTLTGGGVRQHPRGTPSGLGGESASARRRDGAGATERSDSLPRSPTRRSSGALDLYA